jgi:hypothetical protein
MPEVLFSPTPGRGRILLRLVGAEAILSFDGRLLDVSPGDKHQEIGSLVERVRSKLPTGDRHEGVPLAIAVLDDQVLGIESLVPQLLLNVANDFYRDAQKHRIQFGLETQAIGWELARIKDLVDSMTPDEKRSTLEGGELGDTLVRLRQNQRRSLFSCLSCLYACKEAVLYELALVLTDHDRRAADRISRLHGLDGWREVFRMAGATYGAGGLGLEMEAAAREAMDLRDDMTHSGDLYISLPLAGAEQPEQANQLPSYEELERMVGAVGDTLKHYASLLGHPESADLRLREIDLPVFP